MDVKFDGQTILFEKDGVPFQPKTKREDAKIELWQLLARYLVRDFMNRRIATQEQAAVAFGIDVTTLRRLLTERRFSQRTARNILRVHADYTKIPAHQYFLSAYESGLDEEEFIREIIKRQSQASI